MAWPCTAARSSERIPRPAGRSRNRGRHGATACPIRTCRSLTRRVDLWLYSDACRSCELVEVVEVGKAVRAGLDCVSGMVQELADVADALVDRFGPDAEQGGDGDLRQCEAVVQDGGQEP